MATHIAAHSKQGCQLLVCDRSFASLDAAGSRLMGSWAGWGLRWVCMWSTDSVSDYIAASNCHKCVIQDPSDEIIANPASLKVHDFRQVAPWNLTPSIDVGPHLSESPRALCISFEHTSADRHHYKPHEHLCVCTCSTTHQDASTTVLEIILTQHLTPLSLLLLRRSVHLFRRVWPYAAGWATRALPSTRSLRTTC